MTREKKIAKAAALRDAGLSYAKVAERLGVGPGTVWKWLNPETVAAINRRDNAKRNAEKRAWEHANRAACPECGAEMASGSRSPSKRPERCLDCEAARRAQEADALAARYEALWAAGKTLQEIADEMGLVHRHAAGAVISMYRDAGRNFPYRRSPQAVANIREGRAAQMARQGARAA